jgi:DNA-binding response OmpR family regulator
MKNLINKNGKILLYEEILTILWPNSEKVNKTAMRLHIHRLREKTNNISNNLNFIKTLRGKGIYIDTELL